MYINNYVYVYVYMYITFRNTQVETDKKMHKEV